MEGLKWYPRELRFGFTLEKWKRLQKREDPLEKWFERTGGSGRLPVHLVDSSAPEIEVFRDALSSLRDLGVSAEKIYRSSHADAESQDRKMRAISALHWDVQAIFLWLIQPALDFLEPAISPSQFKELADGWEEVFWVKDRLGYISPFNTALDYLAGCGSAVDRFRSLLFPPRAPQGWIDFQTALEADLKELEMRGLRCFAELLRISAEKYEKQKLAARVGHMQTHGTRKSRESEHAKWQAYCDQLHKQKPQFSWTAICRNAARLFESERQRNDPDSAGPHWKTVQKHCQNPRKVKKK